MLLAAPATALTEARITDVSCTGATVVQAGLPPRALFEVELIDAATGKALRERKVRSSAHGALSARLAVPLTGVHRLHAEVAKAGDANAEYGEADVDLDRFCHVTGTEPVPRPSPSQSRQLAPAGTTGDGGGSGAVVATVIAGAVAAGAVGGVVVARRLRRRPRASA